MRKLTKKQVDRLFVTMAEDLHSKYEENVVIIHEKLRSTIPGSAADDQFYLDQIRGRLNIEFYFVLSGNEEKRRKNRNAAKSKTKKKKKKSGATSTSDVVSTKKNKRRTSIDKST